MEKKKKECFQLLPSVKTTICLFILLNLQVAKGGDPCNSYKQLPDFYKRLPKYTTTFDLDDHHLVKHWYGLEGFDIPDKVVHAFHCGTRNTIYLNESLTSAKVFHKNIKVCVAEIYNDCASSFEIEVIGCNSDLRVYHLITSPHLSSGYCFESPNIKDRDLPPKFNPGIVKVEHEVQWTEQTKAGYQVKIPGVVFKCIFDKAPGNLHYTIIWFIDERIVIRKNKTQVPDGRSYLTENDLRNLKNKTMTFGINIKCTVSAHKSPSGLPTDPVESASFFAGIKPKTNKVFVERGQYTLLELEFTIPFGCIHDLRYPVLDKCNLLIEMDYESFNTGGECTHAIGIIGSESNNFCSAKVKGMDITSKEINWKRTITWNISNTDGGQFGYKDNNEHGYRIRLKTKPTDEDTHFLWTDYMIGEIEVKITDSTTGWQNALCYAHCDPHMKTFDGSINEMEQAGVFTLYKHLHIPVEVQIETKPCTGSHIAHAHCVCGTYIRAGGDLFVLSSCNGAMHYDYVQCKDNSLTVYYDETKKYVVYLPTGAKVTVTLMSEWMCNVDINAAPRDKFNVEGLCGNLDVGKANDFEVRGEDLGQKTQCGNGNPYYQCRNKFIKKYKLVVDIICLLYQC